MTMARSTEPKISVLCVDDSALVRSLMTEIINSQPDMHVCATAPDPLVARELIKQHNPDVLTLDVEMPRMDGLDFLEKLMRLRPMPVVMVSSLTERGSEITLRALELGAVDFVTKPRVGIRDGMLEYSEKLADKIRAGARRACAAGECVRRAGRRPFGAGAQGGELRRAPLRRPAGQPAPAVGGCAVPVSRAKRRQERAWCDFDRHGPRRRAGYAGNAASRRLHLRAGRSELRGVRHAARGHRDGRRERGCTAVGNDPARDGAAQLDG